MIAQTMSNSIVITDDHKTHVLPGVQPSHSPLFPENSQAHGESVFSQAPTSSRGPASFRHAYSTTDLQGMQQQLNSQPRSHLTMPLNRSETTSATLIPKNLSRQASPSAPSGQQHKRRKASASGRIRNELTMTKIETPGDSNIIDPGVSSAGQSIAQGSNGLPTFIPNIAAPSNGLPMPPMPLQFNTNSPTSNTTDSTFFSSAQRSQSMENLQGFPRMFSSPSSVRPSRVPSPTSGHQGNALAQSHAQMLTNSLHSVHGAINTLRPPVIHKLTPGEGSKSGGIEVTCLGSGFCQGLEVMFGDAQATTTTYWGESALVCLVPPALQAGVVPVTFKHNYEHNIPSPQTKQAFFKYNDDDEQELMKHALALINRKWNGHASDGSDSARNIINLFGNASSISSSNQSTNQNPQTPCSYATLRGVAELEGALLNCLNTVDLDDSPYQASFNTKGINGQSMLHLSASMGYYRLAAGLLARGANPDLRDNNGMTPMHMASLRNHVQIIRKLRSAGSDPTLRSLNGYTAADMATSQQARDASTAFDCHSRSRSAGATPVSQLSRPSSVMSNKPLRGVQSPVTTAGVSYRKDGGSSGDRLIGNYRRQPATPAQMWGPSRRNSLHAEQQNPNELSRNDLVPNASLFVVNPAMSAWRDQLSAQIQQLQQSVHRTLPTLQIPALPPIPNLPDYQAYPVVRRISSLVPQRNSRSSTVQNHNGLTKEADYCWWELLTGAVSSPPAYDEIYPENKKPDRKASTLRAAEDLIMDRKCEGNFDHAKESSVIETVKLGSGALTKGQLEQLRSSHAIKVRKLKKDRTLLFIWVSIRC